MDTTMLVNGPEDRAFDWDVVRQRTTSQSKARSSGPFTSIVVSNLPLEVLALPSSSHPQAHPARVSTLSGQDILSLSGQLCGHHQRRNWLRGTRFPAAFRPTGIRFSSHPAPAAGIPPSSRSAYQTSKGLDRNGIVTFRMRQIRPDWVPSGPRGMVVRTRPAKSVRTAPAAFQRPIPISRWNFPSARVLMTRRQRGFTRFTRPVFPSL